MSSGVHIYTHSTVARCVSGRALPIERRATTIGSRVHIGANAVILMGCEIGDGSIVAAGAIVKEGTRAPAGSLLVGVPARVIPDAALKFDASRNPSADS
ncbi:DapH/DapD/GlmU-related protein [Agromyces sp. NPDC058064]|uniref:DapH/DapD/GlmU-related protein n=1 Tax=Agromyces sp. NPDC058064 TaxID=3346322 RepID=UPI0036DB9FB3